jgi:outer membrane lipoprotein-sorting protein
VIPVNKVSRWLPAALPAAVIAAAALAVPAFGSAAGADLPAKSPDEVLALIADSSATQFSGTIEQSSDLGLPELPKSAGGYSSSSGQDSTSAILELLTADHTAQVYVDGAQRERVRVLDDLAERDVYRDGSDVWVYDSKQRAAHHLTLPERGDTAPSVTATPAEVADKFLSGLDPSTQVAVETGAVAGRPVYELVLTPKSDATLVGSVTVSVDSTTGLPLEVAVTARGQSQDAVRVGFTAIDFSAPADDVFRFSPSADTDVTEEQLPTAAPEGSAHPELPTPTVTGTGWDTVVSLPVDALGSAGSSRALLDQLTTPVAEGRALQSSLLSVLFTADGRLIAGAVPVEALEAAAR